MDPRRGVPPAPVRYTDVPRNLPRLQSRTTEGRGGKAGELRAPGAVDGPRGCLGRPKMKPKACPCRSRSVTVVPMRTARTGRGPTAPLPDGRRSTILAVLDG